MTSVLDEVREWLGRFIVTTAPDDLDALALWTLHTHVLAQVWSTPRLIITAPLPESGKTTVLDHLSRLCANPDMMANAPTKSVSARSAHMATLLLDEVDKWPNDGDVRQLWSVVNTGYRRGGVYRTQEQNPATGEWEPLRLPTYGAVAFAGIGNGLPDDTLTRSITVHLLPDVHDVAEESDWEFIEGEADALRAKIEVWASTATLAKSEELPDGITRRLREVWRPLQRVADVIGGDWPDRCRALAARHRDNIAAMRDDGIRHERPHMVLIRDLYGVWPIEDGEHSAFVQGEELTRLLRRHSPEMWGDQQRDRDPINVQRMGKMLASNFNITTDRRRCDGLRERGYREERFRPAWQAIGLLRDGTVVGLIRPSDVA